MRRWYWGEEVLRIKERKILENSSFDEKREWVVTSFERNLLEGEVRGTPKGLKG